MSNVSNDTEIICKFINEPTTNPTITIKTGQPTNKRYTLLGAKPFPFTFGTAIIKSMYSQDENYAWNILEKTGSSSSSCNESLNYRLFEDLQCQPNPVAAASRKPSEITSSVAPSDLRLSNISSVENGANNPVLLRSEGITLCWLIIPWFIQNINKICKHKLTCG